MQHSFIMFKPDCLERQLVGKILDRFKNNGINVEIFDFMLATEEVIYSHYSEVIARFGDVFKERARKGFAGKYVIPAIVSSENEDIISNIRTLVGATDPSKAGPGTIRGDFGLDSLEQAMAEDRIVDNLIHASDSYESYLTESKLWFGEDIANMYL